MIIKQYQKPFVPKYANYDYTKVYDGNGRFIGWIRIYHTLKRRRINGEVDKMSKEIKEQK